MTKSFKGTLDGRNINSNGHIEVDKLPRNPEPHLPYWLNSPNGRNEYTHQLFRFPAKFHPPVVRWALGKFGRKGSFLLDPFTGSGTAQVEALVRGISSVGVDIDPLACLVARAKTTPVNPKRLRKAVEAMERMLQPYLRAHCDREARAGADISQERFEREAFGLEIPVIPNITHWFRRYVIIDLARIQRCLNQANLPDAQRQFFCACFASIIRRVSNTDPAPVSGLEVTSIQAERNLNRKIRVFKEFFAKCGQGIIGMDRLLLARNSNVPYAEAHVVEGDSLDLPNLLDAVPLANEGFPLVITSPPYCRAVEYSRRHQLELYWLGFVREPLEHINLTHTYIGRKLARVSDCNEEVALRLPALDRRLKRIQDYNPARARSVGHYFHSMHRFFAALRQVVRRKGTLVCVIGDSRCCKVRIPTADFIAEIAYDNFRLVNRFSYAVRNQHMQYGLWNGDGIKQEHVLVLKAV